MRAHLEITQLLLKPVLVQIPQISIVPGLDVGLVFRQPGAQIQLAEQRYDLIDQPRDIAVVVLEGLKRAGL